MKSKSLPGNRLSLVIVCFGALLELLSVGCESRDGTAGNTDSAPLKRTRDQIHSRSAQPPYKQNQQLLRDDAAAQQIGKNPELVRKTLSALGPGAQRKEYLNKLFREAAINEAVSVDVGIEALQELDESGYPEDVLSIYGNTTSFLKRLGVQRSLMLLERLSSPHIKREIASSLGDLYAESGKVPDPTSFAHLDEDSRVSIYDSIGSKVAGQFRSISELEVFLDSIDRSKKEGSAMLESIVLNPNISIEPGIILEAATSRDHGSNSKSLFEIGIRTLVDKDPRAASEYLSSNKMNLDSDLYVIGVSKLVSYLRKVGDEDSAKKWAAELDTQ